MSQTFVRFASMIATDDTGKMTPCVKRFEGTSGELQYLLIKHRDENNLRFLRWDMTEEAAQHHASRYIIAIYAGAVS